MIIYIYIKHICSESASRQFYVSRSEFGRLTLQSGCFMCHHVSADIRGHQLLVLLLISMYSAR